MVKLARAVQHMNSRADSTILPAKTSTDYTHIWQKAWCKHANTCREAVKPDECWKGLPCAVHTCFEMWQLPQRGALACNTHLDDAVVSVSAVRRHHCTGLLQTTASQLQLHIDATAPAVPNCRLPTGLILKQPPHRSDMNRSIASRVSCTTRSSCSDSCCCTAAKEGREKGSAAQHALISSA